MVFSRIPVYFYDIILIITEEIPHASKVKAVRKIPNSGKTHIANIETGMKSKLRPFVNRMLSYCRETAMQGALYFSPKVEDCMGDNILRTL